MKRIISMTALLTCLITSVYSQEFRVIYNKNTEQEYYMKFRIFDDAPETVEIIEIDDWYPYETLEFPTIVNHEEKEYTLTSINLRSINEKVKKIIIPSTIRWIKHTMSSTTLEEVVIDNAPIESFYSYYGNIYTNNSSQFSGCTNLKSVSFGNACKITVLGWDFFKGCTSLTDVQLPESLTKIGPVFNGCTSLKSIVIPKNVVDIYRSFVGCTSLETVQFTGNAVLSLLEAFTNCESLRSLSVSTESGFYIGDETFKNCRQLVSVDVQSTSLRIEYKAFENCVSLSELNYNSSGLENVGQNAFLNCSSLKEFKIGPDTNIGGSAFAGCTSLEEFKITGEGNNYVDNGVLFHKYPYDIQQLVVYPPGKKDTHYSLPAMITEINDGAFSGATNLEEVTLGDNVTDLGVMVFRDCPKLKEVELSSATNHIPSGTFMGCEALEKVNIHQNYNYIGTGAFKDCRALENIELPENVQVIGEAAFINAGLKKVNVPEKVSEIRDNTFRGCSSLTTVSLPARLTRIGLAALQDCSSLKSINIPEQIDTIEERTFKGCASLTEVVIPDAVKSVGMNAFEQCTSLKSLSTGSGLETLGAWSFYDCTALEKIVFGESLDSIGVQAFDKDINIRDITCLSPEPPAFPTGFPDEVMENATLTVPEGCEDSYYDDLSWAPMVEGWTQIFVEGISIEGMPEGPIHVKDKFQLKAVITPEDATYKSIIWESDNPDVAEVYEDGTVHAVGFGEANITATADDGSGVMAEVTVNVAVAGVDEIIDHARPFKVFDLHGVLLIEDPDQTRLKNLTPGIYILVQGNVRQKFTTK